jgi:PAS domain S-box-containing protein
MDRSPEEIDVHPVFDRITDAYIALDRDWRCTYVNAKACDFFGRPAADLIGRHIWTEFPMAIDQAFRHACERAMAEQQPVFLEALHQPPPDGSRIASIHRRMG